MTRNIRFISAGAGSGKTTRLTQLLEEQLLQGAARPEGVMAMTFTVKAATALRERVRARLLGEQAHGYALAMEQARIGTINAVCGQLLERFAYAAGLPPVLTVLDENGARRVLAEALDSVIDGPDLAGFLEIAGRLGLTANDAWQESLKTLIDLARVNAAPPGELASAAAANAGDLLGHFPPPGAADLSGRLETAIAAALPGLTGAAAGGKRNTAAYLAHARSLRQGLGNGQARWSDWVKLAKSWPEARLKPLAEPINALAAEVAGHPRLQQDIRDYLARLFALGAETLAVYAARKRALGALDFVDQEHLLLTLLDDPAVAEELGEELDLLLIDEFQDTSPLQLALFLKLARLAATVYWVGDIKQAIYGFRGSDTALMDAIVQGLPRERVEVLERSYRSRPALVALVNAVFIPAFRERLDAHPVRLTAERRDADDGLTDPAYGHWVLGGANLRERAVALGHGIAALVCSGHRIQDPATGAARPVRHGDITVLARTGDHAAGVAGALRALGIPAATARPGLLGTPEVTLVLACLRRLLDPADTLATAEILSLADGAEPEDWVMQRLRYLSGGGDPAAWRETAHGGEPAHPWLERLAELRAAGPILTPVEAVQQVMTVCGLPGAVLRWQQDPGKARLRLANLEALRALAAGYTASPPAAAATLPGLLSWLAERAGSGEDWQAEPAVDAVRVMTHHAAKGLEWPVVILTDLGDRLRDRLWQFSAVAARPLRLDDPLGGRRLRYWPWPFGQQVKTDIGERIARTDEARRFQAAAREEGRRLLYVSMTRARDLLILTSSGKPDAGAWLDTLDAPWLLPPPGSTRLALPDGQTLPVLTARLEPGPAPAAVTPPAGPLHGFPAGPAPAVRLPQTLHPSRAAPVNAVILEHCRVGARLPLPGAADMTGIGNALHAALALAFADSRLPPSAAELDRVLRRHGVAGWLTAAAAAGQITAFQDWIAGRWGQAAARAEYPFQAVMPNGQRLRGRIDLLLDTPHGRVIIDHKANPQGAEQAGAVAARHGGQVLAYADALRRITGSAVAEVWLFLPVAGRLLRIA